MTGSDDRSERAGHDNDSSPGPARVAGAADLDIASSAWELERIPAAFAVARGPAHTLVRANGAFRQLMRGVDLAVGGPLADALRSRGLGDLLAVLDRAMGTGAVERDCRIDGPGPAAERWRCTIWPQVDDCGSTVQLLIELRTAAPSETTLALQREVAERMLLRALRDVPVAESADAARSRERLLATAGRRLSASLDEGTTLQAITGLSLLQSGTWCVVDILEPGGEMRRLAIMHRHPTKQLLLRKLHDRWHPRPGDPFGIPAAIANATATPIKGDCIAAPTVADHDAETLRVLRSVDAGPFLTVPLMIGDRLLGALTFVGDAAGGAFRPEDAELAEALAIRAAMALDNARLHGESIELRVRADSANQAKSAFLGTMSHELRTPLNAIGGYVDLIDMGLRGPVTDAQHIDLGRIRSNQRHLTTLVTDLLNFARIDGGRLSYHFADFVLQARLVAGLEMVEPLAREKALVVEDLACDAGILVHADPEKVTQIIVNLLSNAIKFTPAGGRLSIRCATAERAALLRVTDTGIGISSDKLASIFEPFVQVRSGLAGRDSGVGLGLTISRDMARAMGGDLTVESEPGDGSTFTLNLPLARQREAAGHSL